MKAQLHPSRGGFTRLELAMLLGATAILACLTAPALAGSRAKTLRVQCLDNLREVGSAFRRYALDHGDRYPMAVSTNERGSADYLSPTDTGAAENCWRHFWVLSNYLGTPRPLVCPSDDSRLVATNFTRLANANARNAALSYGLGPESFHIGPQWLEMLSADRSLVGGRPQFVFDAQAVRGNIGTNLAQLETLGWSSNGLHRSSGNAAVADGSVRAWSTRDLRAFLARSSSSRNNYMQPGRGPGL